MFPARGTILCSRTAHSAQERLTGAAGQSYTYYVLPVRLHMKGIVAFVSYRNGRVFFTVVHVDIHKGESHALL